MEKEKLISMVSAAQQGSKSAFEELFESVYSDIYYHVLKYVNNDTDLAADITQETSLEIFEHIKDLKEPAAFVTWSQRIAYHRCTAYFRKRRELLADEDADGYSVFDTIEEDRDEFIPGEALDKEELKQAIRNMIDSLPPEQRSAVILRYFNEIPVKDIAEIQGVSEGTVKSRLNYGRKAIKEEVEKYEKKHDVKLHCAGVIPLLLWLLREYKRANNISLTASVPIAAETAAAAAGTAAVTTAAVASTAAAGTTASAAATATAGGFLAKNAVAIAIAAFLTLGSVSAGVLLQPKATMPPTITTISPTVEATTSAVASQPTTLPTEPVESPKPTEPTVPEPKTNKWYGYVEMHNTHTKRLDITVDEMTDTHISGYLEQSVLFSLQHSTSFEGVGSLVDGNIQYVITLTDPVYKSDISDYGSKLTVIYDAQADIIRFIDGPYDGKLKRNNVDSLPVLFADEKWSGEGEDGLDIGNAQKGHLFELEVYKMTEAEIWGRLIVSKNGKIDHDSEFYGRGYITTKGIIAYEVKLDTVREVELFLTYEIADFHLYYNPKKDIFYFPSPGCHYSANMTHEEKIIEE